MKIQYLLQLLGSLPQALGLSCELLVAFLNHHNDSSISVVCIAVWYKTTPQSVVATWTRER